MLISFLIAIITHVYNVVSFVNILVWWWLWNRAEILPFSTCLFLVPTWISSHKMKFSVCVSFFTFSNCPLVVVFGLTLYFKVILPFTTNGPVVGCWCNNRDHFYSLEQLHCSAVKIVFNLPRVMPSEGVLVGVGWNTLSHYYTTTLLKSISKIQNNVTPSEVFYQICYWHNNL